MGLTPHWVSQQVLGPQRGRDGDGVEGLTPVGLRPSQGSAPDMGFSLQRGSAPDMAGLGRGLKTLVGLSPRGDRDRDEGPTAMVPRP